MLCFSHHYLTLLLHYHLILLRNQSVPSTVIVGQQISPNKLLPPSSEPVTIVYWSERNPHRYEFSPDQCIKPFEYEPEQTSLPPTSKLQKPDISPTHKEKVMCTERVKESFISNLFTMEDCEEKKQEMSWHIIC